MANVEIDQLPNTQVVRLLNGNWILATNGNATFLGNISVGAAVNNFLGAAGNALFAGARVQIDAAGNVEINAGNLFFNSGEWSINNDGSAQFSTSTVLITSTGDIEITDTLKGVILRSPLGNRFRLKVGDAGELGTEPA